MKSKVQNILNYWKENKLLLLISFLILIFLITITLVYSYFSQEQEQVNNQNQETEAVLPNSSYNKILDVVKQTNGSWEKYAQTLQNQVNTVDGLAAVSGITQFGNLAPSYQSLLDLNTEIKNLKLKYNEPVSFIMYDLNSDSGIYYSIDFQTYSASSIKLPYIASIIDQDPEIFCDWQDSIINILQFSSNEDYDMLRFNYGNENFLAWDLELNIEHSMATDWYPSFITAKDMLKVWFKTFYVLNTNKYSAQLSDVAFDSVNSPIYLALGSKYKICSKPGWFDGPDISDLGYCFNGITNDAGVIYSGENPYLLVVLSELSQDVEAIAKLVKSIDQAHDSMISKL